MAQKITLSANYRRNYVAFFAVFLFFAVVIGQIALAVGIPMIMSRDSLMAENTRRLAVLSLFDAARHECRKPVKNEIAKLEQKLLLAQLDRTAIYLHKERDRLTPQEVNRLNEVLRELYTVAVKISSGVNYTGESKLDIAPYLNNTLKERTAPNVHK